MKKRLLLCLLSLLLCLCACAGPAETAPESAGRRLTDGLGRSVALPDALQRVVCVGVGALRYTCYLDAAELVVGVEDYEKEEQSLRRMYNYVNYHHFRDLPAIGGNGEPWVEAIVAADPQVIVMSASASADADQLSAKTGLPVFVIPGSDSTLDDKCYRTIELLGQLYERPDRARELADYLRQSAAELAQRAQASQLDPTVYVAGISYKGARGFEGTEAGYGPLALLGARNLADGSGQSGAFQIDTEQVLVWDPEVLLLDYNGLALIAQDYANNPGYYDSLRAVQQGRIYSQISFRDYASNLDTALVDAWYAGCVLYPDSFADVDPEQKAGEIFTQLLGSDPYPVLKEAGYGLQTLTLAP